MDRPPRNVVGLVTLFIASLGSVAILAAERDRSAINTAIMVVLATAAAGSLLALVLGSVWFGVLRGDVRGLWAKRTYHRWVTSHHPAETPDAMTFDFDAGPMEAAIRAEGMPCLVSALEPRTVDIALTRPLEGVYASCTFERRARRWGRAERIDVIPKGDDQWGGRARWPDQWFDPEREGPTPGHYRVRWKLRFPDGRIELPTERVHVGPEGEAHVGRLSRAASAVRGVIRHYRGRDD